MCRKNAHFLRFICCRKRPEKRRKKPKNFFQNGPKKPGFCSFLEIKKRRKTITFFMYKTAVYARFFAYLFITELHAMGRENGPGNDQNRNRKTPGPDRKTEPGKPEPEKNRKTKRNRNRKTKRRNRKTGGRLKRSKRACSEPAGNDAINAGPEPGAGRRCRIKARRQTAGFDRMCTFAHAGPVYIYRARPAQADGVRGCPVYKPGNFDQPSLFRYFYQNSDPSHV